MKKTRTTTKPTTASSTATKRPRSRRTAQSAPTPPLSPSLPPSVSPSQLPSISSAPALPLSPSPSATTPAIPAGYRELHQGEKILRSDHILVDGAWTRRDSPAGRTKSWALGESYNCYPDGHPAYPGFHHLTLRRLPRTAQPAQAPTLSPSLPLSVPPSSADPGPGYRLLTDDEPLLAGDQINDTDGTWQKPLRRDDPPTLRQRRKNLSTPESRRAWPGRSTQIQVRRKLPAPAEPTPAPSPTPHERSLPAIAAPASPTAYPADMPAPASSPHLSVPPSLPPSGSPAAHPPATHSPHPAVSPSLPPSVSAPAATWRQLAPGELIAPGDEVTARPTDDLQAPAGTQLWIAHRPDDPGLGHPVPARTPCRYRRLAPAYPLSHHTPPASSVPAPENPEPAEGSHPLTPHPPSTATVPAAAVPAEPTSPVPASSALSVSPSLHLPLSPASDTAPKPGPGHRLLRDDDILRPGDQRTRQKSYAGAWEPVGATLHGLTIRAARRVYSPHNAEGQPDPLHFRRPYLAPDQRTPLALPAGTRELAPGEPILPTDHYLWGHEWLPRAGTRNLGRPYHPGQNRLTIRALPPTAPATPPLTQNPAAFPTAPSSMLTTPPHTRYQVNIPAAPPSPSLPPAPSSTDAAPQLAAPASTHSQVSLPATALSPSPALPPSASLAPTLTTPPHTHNQVKLFAATTLTTTPAHHRPGQSEALHAHTDAATAATQAADTPALSPSLAHATSTAFPVPDLHPAALSPELCLSVPPSAEPTPIPLPLRLPPAPDALSPHRALLLPTLADPGAGYRALAPEEVIQPGDEWMCPGTGCPTYRTLNPHHGRTVSEVNAHRSPDLPRHYRRPLPEPTTTSAATSPTPPTPYAPLAPVPTPAEPATTSTASETPILTTTASAQHPTLTPALSATAPTSAPAIPLSPHLSFPPSPAPIPDHPGQLYLTPDLRPPTEEKLIAIAYHTTLPDGLPLRVTRYTDGSHLLELPHHPPINLPAPQATTLRRALTIVA